MQRLYNMSLKKPYSNQKQIAKKNKILKDTVYILILESHLTQKDRFHHTQNENRI